MKCPKCKYITFDYLDICPRCGKDMSAEKAKLSIFSIKPDPPSLLGSLTGDLNDSSVELRVPESIKKGAGDMKLRGEEVYDDGSELNINIDEEPLLGSGEEPEFDLGELTPSDDEKELELDFISDAIGRETKRAPIEEEDTVEAGSKAGVGQRDVQKEESKKDSEKGALELGDLELKLDFDEDEDTK